MYNNSLPPPPPPPPPQEQEEELVPYNDVAPEEQVAYNDVPPQRHGAQTHSTSSSNNTTSSSSSTPQTSHHHHNPVAASFAATASSLSATAVTTAAAMKRRLHLPHHQHHSLREHLHPGNHSHGIHHHKKYEAANTMCDIPLPDSHLNDPVVAPPAPAAAVAPLVPKKASYDIDIDTSRQRPVAAATTAAASSVTFSPATTNKKSSYDIDIDTSRQRPVATAQEEEEEQVPYNDVPQQRHGHGGHTHSTSSSSSSINTRTHSHFLQPTTASPIPTPHNTRQPATSLAALSATAATTAAAMKRHLHLPHMPHHPRLDNLHPGNHSHGIHHHKKYEAANTMCDIPRPDSHLNDPVVAPPAAVDIDIDATRSDHFKQHKSHRRHSSFPPPPPALSVASSTQSTNSHSHHPSASAVTPKVVVTTTRHANDEDYHDDDHQLTLNDIEKCNSKSSTNRKRSNSHHSQHSHISTSSSKNRRRQAEEEEKQHQQQLRNMVRKQLRQSRQQKLQQRSGSDTDLMRTSSHSNGQLQRSTSSSSLASKYALFDSRSIVECKQKKTTSTPVFVEPPSDDDDDDHITHHKHQLHRYNGYTDSHKFHGDGSHSLSSSESSFSSTKWEQHHYHEQNMSEQRHPQNRRASFTGMVKQASTRAIDVGTHKLQDMYTSSQAKKGSLARLKKYDDEFLDVCRLDEARSKLIGRVEEPNMIKLLSHWSGTILDEVIYDAVFWLTLCMYAALRIWIQTGHIDPTTTAAAAATTMSDGMGGVAVIAAGDTSMIPVLESLPIVGGFLTLFLVFYVNQNHERYYKLHDNTMFIMGRICNLSTLMAAAAPKLTIERARRINRYCNAAHVVMYAGLTQYLQEGKLVHNLVRDYSLLTDEETERMEDCGLHQGKASACFELLTWALKDVNRALHRDLLDVHQASEMRELIVEFRSMVAEIVVTCLCPIPFFYVHFLSLLTAIYLPLFAMMVSFKTGSDTEASPVPWYAEVVGFFLVLLQCIFVVGLRILGQQLGNPYGEDFIDIQITTYIIMVLSTSNRILESTDNNEINMIDDPYDVDPDTELELKTSMVCLGQAWGIKQSSTSFLPNSSSASASTASTAATPPTPVMIHLHEHSNEPRRNCRDDERTTSLNLSKQEEAMLEQFRRDNNSSNRTSSTTTNNSLSNTSSPADRMTRFDANSDDDDNDDVHIGLSIDGSLAKEKQRQIQTLEHDLFFGGENYQKDKNT